METGDKILLKRIADLVEENRRLTQRLALAERVCRAADVYLLREDFESNAELTAALEDWKAGKK